MDFSCSHKASFTNADFPCSEHVIPQERSINGFEGELVLHDVEASNYRLVACPGCDLRLTETSRSQNFKHEVCNCTSFNS